MGSETKQRMATRDAQLFHIMVAGHDRNALDAGLELYPRMRQLLGSFIRFKLGDLENDWEDIFQDVMMAASAQPNRAPVIGKAFLGWLFKIAGRKCFNRVTRGHDVEPLPEEEPCSRADGPVTQVIKAGERALIRAAIDKLPPKLAEMVANRYLDDLSVQEIAERLGDDTRHVRRHLGKGRNQVKRSLESVASADTRVRRLA